jgi:hypothetical protein
LLQHVVTPLEPLEFLSSDAINDPFGNEPNVNRTRVTILDLPVAQTEARLLLPFRGNRQGGKKALSSLRASNLLLAEWQLSVKDRNARRWRLITHWSPVLTCNKLNRNIRTAHCLQHSYRYILTSIKIVDA